MNAALIVIAGLIVLWLFTGLPRTDRSAMCACCGKTRPEAARIVKGPGLGICDACVQLAADAFTRPVDERRLPCGARQRTLRAITSCSFCGTTSDEPASFAALAKGSICADCVQLCIAILRDAPEAAT
jgi:ATP-dependent protease Clp ATPase subunit